MTPTPAVPDARPPIRDAASFGERLTDAGTFGIRFTANPGLVWAQHVAPHHG